MENEKVKKYWDENPARAKWDSFDAELNYIENEEHWILTSLDRICYFEKKVLDVGCGQGVQTYYLASKGIDVLGIDISSESVSIANNRLANVGINPCCIPMDAENMSFENNIFDCVVSIGVLHHTSNIKKSASEIARVLKPKGTICIMLYRKWSVQFGIIKILRYLNKKTNFFRKSNERKKYGTMLTELFTCPIMNSYSANEIEEIFSDFENFEFYAVNVGLVRLRDFIPVNQKVQNILIAIDEFLQPIFGCHLVFYATKKEKI